MQMNEIITISWLCVFGTTASFRSNRFFFWHTVWWIELMEFRREKNSNNSNQLLRLIVSNHWNLSTGIHAFDTEEELQQFFQRNKNNRNFAIIFTQDGSNGQLNYTIRTRNNNFRTEQIFLNNIYEITTRGKHWDQDFFFENENIFLSFLRWFSFQYSFKQTCEDQKSFNLRPNVL